MALTKIAIQILTRQESDDGTGEGADGEDE
jgi:hypothetical protein